MADRAHDRTKSKVELPTLANFTMEGYPLDLDYFLKTHYVSVQAATSELPPVIEWINGLLQTAIEKKHMAKAGLKQAEGEAFHQLRIEEGWAQAGFTGKITEKALEAGIPLMNDVIQANEKYAKATGLVSRLQNMLLSFQAKLDLVRSSEATRRALVQGTEQDEQQ